MANLEFTRAPRLDYVVLEQLPMLTRSYVTRLIDDGKVKVNGEVATKTGQKIRPDDTIDVDFDPVQLEQIGDIDIPVLYEDADCVVINKPEGILTHSKGVFNPEPTVASWLRMRLLGMSGERAGIVHRLDRLTSGVMICAKTPAAQAWIQKQFSQRRVKKQYQAIIDGQMEPLAAVIDMPLERNPSKPQTFHVSSTGKVAITEYHTLRTTQHYSLLDLRPETGRTHQLRVHLEKLGHPIVGDPLYVGSAGPRLMLHAAALELTLPNHERQVFTVEVPTVFSEFLDNDN